MLQRSAFFRVHFQIYISGFYRTAKYVLDMFIFFLPNIFQYASPNVKKLFNIMETLSKHCGNKSMISY